MFSLACLSEKSREFVDQYQDEFNRRLTQHLRAEKRLTDEDITVKSISEGRYRFDQIVLVEDLSIIFGKTAQSIRKRIRDLHDGLVYQDRSYQLSPFAACFFYPPQREFYSPKSSIPCEDVLEELLLSSGEDPELVRLVTTGCSTVYGASFFNLYDVLHQRWALAMEDEEQRKELLNNKVNGKVRTLVLQNDDEIARLVASSENFMYLVIRKMGIRRGDQKWDMAVSAGRFGLFEAARRYDSSTGNKFLSYAVHYIRGHILTDLLKDHNMVRMGASRSQAKLFYGLPKWQRGEIKELPANASSEDIAQYFEVSVRTVRMMQKRLAKGDVSLDQKLYDDGEDTLLDRIASVDPTPEEAIISADPFTKKLVQEVIAVLNDRERYIVENHILAENENERTLKEIGEHFGITRERTRQLKAMALQKMRKRIIKLHPYSYKSYLTI